MARSRQASASRPPNSPVSTGPAAPEASSSTVSLVDSAPSTVRQLNDTPTADRRRSVAVVASRRASVVSTASIVAMFGSSIAAPLATPPMVNVPPSSVVPVSAVVLGTVSVVMIARAAAGPPSSARAAATVGMAGMILSMGSGKPMRPVEQTRTSCGEQPSASAVRAHIVSASVLPAAPVAALALPLFRTTAAARPPVVARCSRLTSTGGAVIRLEVNTPAAVTGEPSAVATMARSSAPDALIPQAIPAATKPGTVVTLMGRPR